MGGSIPIVGCALQHRLPFCSMFCQLFLLIQCIQGMGLSQLQPHSAITCGPTYDMVIRSATVVCSLSQQQNKATHPSCRPPDVLPCGPLPAACCVAGCRGNCSWVLPVRGVPQLVAPCTLQHLLLVTSFTGSRWSVLARVDSNPTPSTECETAHL